MGRYLIPASTQRVEIEVLRSRFIATVGFVGTTEDARLFIARIKHEMPTASHHVYAFRVGYGNSVIEGVSDDGEPTGTAGPPILSILRGLSIGDIIVVVTRYFGGTKLGTGGLVRAYSDATRLALDELNTEEKVEKRLLGIDVPYALYERTKLLITAHNGTIQDETFAGEISLMLQFPLENIPAFEQAITNLSSGQVDIVYFD